MENKNTSKQEKAAKPKKDYGVLYIYVLFIAVGLYASYIALNNYNTPESFGEFMDCVASKNITMYGTSWCHYCNQQKDMLSPYFDKINFIDCDVNRSECLSMGVTGYPTWFSNGVKYEGLQTLDKLSAITGCPIKQ